MEFDCTGFDFSVRVKQGTKDSIDQDRLVFGLWITINRWVNRVTCSRSFSNLKLVLHSDLLSGRLYY